MATGQARAKGEVARTEGSSGLLLTLDRGIQVLEQVARGQGRATAKSLTSELGINLGTCYQLLRTLQAHGYVHRLHGGRYGLGNRVGFLADHYSNALAPPPELIETLHALHTAVEETAYLAVPHNGDLPVVATIEGTRMLRVGGVAVGQSGDPLTSPAARAFLAFADETAWEELIDSRPTDRGGARSGAALNRLRRELAETRRRGYAIALEEQATGVAGLGAAIVDEEGRAYGAYAVALPAARVGAEERQLAKQLLGAAEKASRSMGYAGSYPPAPDTPAR